jgi:hypothetical protein
MHNNPIKASSIFTWSLVNFFTLFFLLTLFIYTVARAYLLSMTHDEALTIIQQGSQPFINILIYNKAIQSNNHLFNSLWVRFVIITFGYNEFLIRLAGLLGGALYLFGAYKLCTMFFGRTFLYYMGLALLIFNPYVLDFFP